MFYLKYISKIFVLLSILILAILLSISIIKIYIAHTYYSEYEKVLNENKQDAEDQFHYLRNALEFSPSNALYYFEHGRFYINEVHAGKNKSHKPAKEYFQEALTRKPTDSRYWAEYAWYTGHSGETGKAIEFFNRAIFLGATDAYAHKLYARWCVDQIKDEINIEDISLFAKVYRNKQYLDETLQSYNNRFIDSVSIAAFLKKARMEWDKALALGTQMNSTAHNSLADLNLLRFEIDEAIGNYNRANNKIMQARCYFIKGDHSKDVGILRSMIKGGGTPFWGNLTKIKKLLLDIVKEDPKNHQSFYWLAETYTKTRMTEETIVNFEAALKLKPRHIDTHLNLAKLYGRTGKTDLAIKEYKTILSINPNHKETTKLLSEAIRHKYKNSGFLTK